MELLIFVSSLLLIILRRTLKLSILNKIFETKLIFYETSPSILHIHKNAVVFWLNNKKCNKKLVIEPVISLIIFVDISKYFQSKINERIYLFVQLT